MQENNQLPQKHNIDQINAPEDIKTFGITKLGFNSFDELIQHSSQTHGVEYEFFFSNTFETQYGYMKVASGKIVKTIPLLKINLTEAVPVYLRYVLSGYFVTYCTNTSADSTSVFIPIRTFKQRILLKYFSVPPQASKNNTFLCNQLLVDLITEKSKAFATNKLIIGMKQGWNIISGSLATWESRGKYPLELAPIIPKSILCRKTAKENNKLFQSKDDFNPGYIMLFKEYPELKKAFLLRLASYFLSFAAENKLYWNQVVGIKLTEQCDISLILAFFDNVNYRCGDNLLLTENKKLKTAVTLLNDCILLVIDNTKADEDKLSEKKCAELEKVVLESNSKFHQLPIIVYENAASQFKKELFCDFSVLNGHYDINPSTLAELLEWHDSKMLRIIQENYIEFRKIYNLNIKNLSHDELFPLPPHRRDIYIILAATLRTYAEFINASFYDDTITEKTLFDFLIYDDEVGSSTHELLLTSFSKCINQEIDSGSFNFIKKKKYIVFDQETNSVIVDDDNIYVETAVIKNLALNKMKLHSVNSLTEALKANGCLTINDQNSKCYRFHVQNTNGNPYMLYTYGISKLLINAESRKLLALADKEKFLLTSEELLPNCYLPLGVTSDGKYVGKDISFNAKSNDSVLITGQSGKGKSFCATNLLPSLAMLGSRMLVCDVSDSFTRDEVLRALPEEVVNALFEFIDVADGKQKLPVNLLFIGDCSGLPAKKRRIVGFIKVIAGKLDKDENRTLTGIISDMLKRESNASSITTEMLRNALKRGGKVGNHVFSLISSTLDDIDNIGFEEQGWGEFFENTKKIPVLSFGNESGDNVHSLLDAVIASAFEWQRDHGTAPLSIVVDEIKDQNFTEGNPLHTILTQGRKFHTKFIGMTQHYISTSSHAIDVVKEAGIKIFFKPAKSLDKIAAELEYKNPADAGFGAMGIGDIILSAELFNKIDGVNESVVIHAKTIKFIDTPLYDKFKELYGC